MKRKTGPKTIPPEVRFWPKVSVGDANECWPWNGGNNGRGYGVFGRTWRKMQYAHRFAWEVTHGPVPDGLCVCHHCDNPPCCNPAHLFIGTIRDNSADMVAKGRAAKHPESRGASNGNAKLTQSQVRSIRRLASSGFTQIEVGAFFKVNRRSIARIWNGSGWIHE